MSSKIYLENYQFHLKKHNNNNNNNHSKIILCPLDSIEALRLYGTDHTCILNFSDWWRPGGLLADKREKDVWGQEEALCAHSNLYDELSSLEEEFYAPNRSNNLFANRAIYSRDIKFDNGRIADVLTCAAPLYFGNEADYKRTIWDRLDFIHNILDENEVEVFIAGAWGCGYFGNNTMLIAEAMRNQLCGIPKIVYALPDGGKFNIFKRVYS